ncbi:hypothetical protein LDENG_00120060 [Lucifuga dentata]|nr:hypothetical protein LDENG_00120060 [Lucifuga dentata]
MSPAKYMMSLMMVLVAAVCVANAQDRIKMCGRDLVRLAVSSCGNSRLRRDILDEDLELPETAQMDLQASETISVPPQSDVKNDVFSLAPHWYPLPPRIRRSAWKLADICCEEGCTMKQLIQFC